MEMLGAAHDRHLDPPDEIQHCVECPLSSDKPWRPARCTCEEVVEQHLEDRADAERKGEL